MNTRKVGRPKNEDRGKTLAALKPWAKMGISRRTWFRLEAKKHSMVTQKEGK